MKANQNQITNSPSSSSSSNTNTINTKKVIDTSSVNKKNHIETQFIKKIKTKIFKITDIPTLYDKLKDKTIINQFYALAGIKYLLDHFDEAYKLLMELEIFPLLNNFLIINEYDEPIQQEALSIIETLSIQSDNKELITPHILTQIEQYINLLAQGQNSQICLMIINILGITVSEIDEHHQVLLKLDVLDIIVKSVLQKYQNELELNDSLSIAYFLLGLCEGKKDLTHYYSIITYYGNLIACGYFDENNNQENDEYLEIVLKILNLLLTNANESIIQLVLDTGCLSKIIKYIESSKKNIQYEAVLFIGSIAFGNNFQTEYLMLNLPSDKYEKALDCNNDSIIRNILWGMSNIAIGSKIHKKYFLDNEGLMNKILMMSKKASYAIRYEAIYLISNIICDIDQETLCDLVKYSLLEELIESLETEKNAPILYIILDAIDYYLQAITQGGIDNTNSDKHHVITKIIKLGGNELIKDLIQHGNNKISGKASIIYAQYFKHIII